MTDEPAILVPSDAAVYRCGRIEPMVRAASYALHAVFASIGAALLASPALAWVRGLGLDRPVMAADVPLGWAAVLLGLALIAAVCVMAVRAALGRSPGAASRIAVLLIAACALALRAGIGELRRGPDPAPRLVDAMAIVAEALDAEYARTHRYASPSRLLEPTSIALPPTGLVHRGRELRAIARVLTGMRSPQLDAIAGDAPGTIYVAISPDEQSAWVSALSLDGVLPITVHAHGGTHSPPGFDALLPLYPKRRAR